MQYRKHGGRFRSDLVPRHETPDGGVNRDPSPDVAFCEPSHDFRSRWIARLGSVIQGAVVVGVFYRHQQRHGGPFNTVDK